MQQDSAQQTSRAADSDAGLHRTHAHADAHAERAHVRARESGRERESEREAQARGVGRMATVVAQSPRKVHSDVFEVCEDPVASKTLGKAGPTSIGPPVGSCTPTKARRAALRSVENCNTRLDVDHNSGGYGTEFVPLPDQAVTRAPADAAYNDGSCGLPFEPLQG